MHNDREHNAFAALDILARADAAAFTSARADAGGKMRTWAVKCDLASNSPNLVPPKKNQTVYVDAASEQDARSQLARGYGSYDKVTVHAVRNFGPARNDAAPTGDAARIMNAGYGPTPGSPEFDALPMTERIRISGLFRQRNERENVRAINAEMAAGNRRIAARL